MVLGNWNFSFIFMNWYSVTSFCLESEAIGDGDGDGDGEGDSVCL
jgi:hypothetical protein